MFSTIIEKVIFGTGQIVCQGWFINENVKSTHKSTSYSNFWPALINIKLLRFHISQQETYNKTCPKRPLLKKTKNWFSRPIIA